MSLWLHRWVRPSPYPCVVRSHRRRTPRFGRLIVEELEERLSPSANVPITTDSGVQQNPAIAADPNDGNHLVVAYMDYSLLTTGYAGIGVAVSFDAGADWQYTSILLPAPFDQGSADPHVAFDDQGHVYVSFMAATYSGALPPITDDIVSAGLPSDSGIFVVRSDNGGLTWNAPVAVASDVFDGHDPVNAEIDPDLAIDIFSTLSNGQPNPYYGSLYVAWSRFYAAGQFPGEPTTSTGGSQLMFAISWNDGLTWQLQLQQPAGSSVPETVLLDSAIQDPGVGPPPGFGYDAYAHPVVGPEGDIYVSAVFAGGLFGVYHSTDGGQSFTPPDPQGSQGEPFGTLIYPNLGEFGLPNLNVTTYPVRAIAADPDRPGSVYVAEMNNAETDDGTNLVNAAGTGYADPADIILSRSADSGVTWNHHPQIGPSPDVSELNDDNFGQLANGSPDDAVADQIFPALATDAQGDLVIIWYDTRRDPNNLEFDVYGAVSTDGGQTFSPNFRITDQTFSPSAGTFTDATGNPDDYLGASIGVALANGTAYAVWTDTRNGNQDIDFSSFPVQPPPAPPTNRFGPNGTPATATDLGQVVALSEPKLTIAAGEQEWFQLQAAVTGPLTVTATLAEPADSVRLELFAADGATQLAAGTALLDAAGQVTGQSLTFSGQSGATYLVCVLPGPAAAAGVPAVYTLGVQDLTADLGSQVSGDVSGSLAAGAQDYFALTVAAAGSLEVTLTPGATAQGNFSLQVLDPSDLSVLATGQSGGAGQVASLATAQGQTVYLRVFGDAGTQGDFSLEFLNLDQFLTPQNSSLLFPAGQGPSEVAVADLTGSGKPDLVVSDTQENTVSVLLNNGDGTFQAPREYPVGAFTPPLEPNLGRPVAVADLNGDDVPDIIVANSASDDISVLLGHGDGTFAPQLRFETIVTPLALAVGDLTGNGIQDVVVFGTLGRRLQGYVAVLLGRGDGTFQPALVFPTPNLLALISPPPAIRIANLTRDGHPDLLVSGGGLTSVFLGNGDGTFRTGASVPILVQALALADLNNDGNLDLIGTNYGNNTVYYALGNGDGTFQTPVSFLTGQSPVAVTVADVAGVASDGSTVLGVPDGIPDLLVAASGFQQPVLYGPSQVLLYAGQVDAQGNFTGFSSSPLVLATGPFPIDVQTADLNGDDILDVVVVESDGIRVIYGKPLVLPDNNTPQTARNLGTVVHVVEPTQTIVPGHQDSYFTLTVPTEVVRGAGNEVLDFSGFFQGIGGLGLTMQILDAGGNLLGQGERFQVSAPQGSVLILHVFGLTGTGRVLGNGAYTLDIDVLPQVISVAAEALLPGAGDSPGGPTSSLVITLQGDRLDQATAEDPSNYAIIWLGPAGVLGSADNQVIPLASGPGVQSVVYDPSSNVDVASGAVYPTAIRQTVTLLFAGPLPAGSYVIDLSSAIQAAPFNDEEMSQLTAEVGFTGHPVVSVRAGQIAAGSQRTVADLVVPSVGLGNLDVWQTGTPFLSQLHDDLGALLDALLTALGDDPSIPAAIDNQIIARIDPALGPPGQRPIGVLVIWIDPASAALLDPNGDRAITNLQDNSFLSTFSQAYVRVAGNVDLFVLPLVATVARPYLLELANVPPSVRAGAVYFGLDATQVTPLTQTLRDGTSTVTLTVGSQQGLPAPSLPITLPVPAAVNALADPGDFSQSPSAVLTNLLVRTQSAPVTPIVSLFVAPAAGGQAGPNSTVLSAQFPSTTPKENPANSSAESPPRTPPPAIVNTLLRIGEEIRKVIAAVFDLFRGLFREPGNAAALPRPEEGETPAAAKIEEDANPEDEGRATSPELSDRAGPQAEAVLSESLWLSVCVGLGTVSLGPEPGKRGRKDRAPRLPGG